MSDPLELYGARIRAHGESPRTAMFKREVRLLRTRLKDSLSYHIVNIDDVEREVGIINSDNLNEKYIYSMPCEDFDSGQIVEFANNHWLITEKDANNEVYTRGIMLQCNHQLKWVDKNDVIHSQWCVVEDGTKLYQSSFRVVRAA